MLSVTHSVTAFPWHSESATFCDRWWFPLRTPIPWRSTTIGLHNAFHDAARLAVSMTHSMMAFPWRSTSIAFHDAFPWRCAPRCFHDAFRDTFSVTLSRCWFPWRLSMTFHRCCIPWNHPWRLLHDIPKVLHSVIADVFRYAFRDDYSVTLHNYRFA